MPRIQWPLRHGRPCVEIILVVAATGQLFPRILLADTGSGPRNALFQLVLDESDCLLCGGNPIGTVLLGGAYRGPFTTYGMLVRLPALGFDQGLTVVGVPSPPPRLDGIAAFGFLNRF